MRNWLKFYVFSHWNLDTCLSFPWQVYERSFELIIWSSWINWTDLELNLLLWPCCCGSGCFFFFCFCRFDWWLGRNLSTPESLDGTLFKRAVVSHHLYKMLLQQFARPVLFCFASMDFSYYDCYFVYFWCNKFFFLVHFTTLSSLNVASLSQVWHMGARPGDPVIRLQQLTTHWRGRLSVNALHFCSIRKTIIALFLLAAYVQM